MTLLKFLEEIIKNISNRTYQIKNAIEFMHKFLQDIINGRRQRRFNTAQLNRGIRIIHEGLRQAVEKWSGGDPNEQQDLISMRDNFYRLLSRISI